MKIIIILGNHQLVFCSVNWHFQMYQKQGTALLDFWQKRGDFPGFNVAHKFHTFTPILDTEKETAETFVHKVEADRVAKSTQKSYFKYCV